MIKKQKTFINYLSDLKKVLNEKEDKFNTKEIKEFKKNIKDIELLVPVVGGFSAGKSTLINNFLGEDYLPVGITPETSLATELRFSDEEYILAIKDEELNYDKYEIDEFKK